MDINQVKKINTVLSKKHSLTILYSAKVENGIATFTDLENWVEIPTTWKNGLYCKRNIPAQGEHAFDIEDTSDFPYPVEMKNKKPVCNMNELNEKIINFFSTDEARAMLCGVYLDAKNNCAIATDGHKMHFHSMKINKSVIVRKEFILLSKKLNCNQVSHFTNKKTDYVMSEGNNVRILSKCHESPYPDYRVVLGYQGITDTKIQINEHRDTLRNAINTVLSFSNCITHLIRFEDNWMCVANRDMGKFVKVNIGIKPFPFPMGFNGAYLLKVLEVAEGTLHIPDKNCKGIQFMSKNSTTLLMPLRLIDNISENDKPLSEYTEIPIKTDKPKTKKPNYKTLYEALLVENKELKKKIEYSKPVERIAIKNITKYADKPETVRYI